MARPSRIKEHEWILIKQRYMEGESTAEIAKDYGIHYSLIQKKSKSDGWGKNGEISKIIQKRAIEVCDLIENTELPPATEEYQIKDIHSEILDVASLRLQAQKVQHNMLNLITKAQNQVRRVFDENESGMHVKSQGENGITYSRNTEFIKDLSGVMNSLNKLIGVDQEQTNIQINNNQDTQRQVVLEIQPVKVIGNE